ncbi:MAG: bifunctional phosphoribosylaminoimidazolecarboxamide formyltransferase/IMP cyclohydrolase [Anaerolineae bacterium]|nr:bifunctional phosphoribosylaminoimidazolecarboxamide formyltransferase/IMP cyclohydrolase [Anaerolineae bacterium]
MPRVILSVSDKRGIVELAHTLSEQGWDLVASGGTADVLRTVGLPVTPIEVITGLPELLGGGIKTLHPAIHAGILARDDRESDRDDLAAHGYAPVSMVVCNLSPFAETVRQQNVTLDEAIEQLDVGGVTLLRAAAKNFARVTAVCDPEDYPRLIAMLRGAGEIDAATRHALAIKAFAYIRNYDTEVHAFLLRQAPDNAASAAVDSPLPDALSLGLVKTQELEYGANPQQQAAFYALRAGTPPLGGRLIGGKTLTYQNVLDLDLAWQTVSAFAQPAAALVKGGFPIWIATGEPLATVIALLAETSPPNAAAGVIAVNRLLDEPFAAALGPQLIEAIAAPEFTPTAQAKLSELRRSCRLLTMPPDIQPGWELRSVRGGFLVQSSDRSDLRELAWQTVTNASPTLEQLKALQFAWRCVQFVPSHAIVLTQANNTVSVAGGSPDQGEAVRLALQKAGANASATVLAADTPLTEAASLHLAAAAGVMAVVQPGSSIHDSQVIAAANETGLAMIFTAVRHYRY